MAGKVSAKTLSGAPLAWTTAIFCGGISNIWGSCLDAFLGVMAVPPRYRLFERGIVCRQELSIEVGMVGTKNKFCFLSLFGIFILYQLLSILE